MHPEQAPTRDPNTPTPDPAKHTPDRPDKGSDKSRPLPGTGR